MKIDAYSAFARYPKFCVCFDVYGRSPNLAGISPDERCLRAKKLIAATFGRLPQVAKCFRIWDWQTRYTMWYSKRVPVVDSATPLQDRLLKRDDD